MVKDIKFTYNKDKACWQSDEVVSPSMAYVQVERKGMGWLRVYAYAAGKKPVTAHVTQQRITAFLTGYLPVGVTLRMESETEVESCVLCQDGVE